MRATCLKIPGLTRREAEVLKLSLQGFSNKEIGKLLGIATRTAKYHRHGVFKRLGIRTGGESLGEIRNLFGRFEVEVRMKWVPKCQPKRINTPR